MQLIGSGLLEGASTYRFAGASVVDSQVNGGPDVTFDLSTFTENNRVNLSAPAHGLGDVSVSTAGGTSAPLPLNLVNPDAGSLSDVSFGAGQLWMIDNANPNHFLRIDPLTGKTEQTISLTDDFGSTRLGQNAGLQVLGGKMTLGTTAVPAGSRLLFNGNAGLGGDRVVAINPANGSIIASLSLAQSYQSDAGVYDAVSGHLLVIDRRTNERLVEINPATGAEVGSFVLPANSFSAGLAIDPKSGNLWYGSDRSSEVVELTRAGVEVRRLNVALQGIDNNEISGLAFDADGKLLVASIQGVVYRVTT